MFGLSESWCVKSIAAIALVQHAFFTMSAPKTVSAPNKLVPHTTHTIRPGVTTMPGSSFLSHGWKGLRGHNIITSIYIYIYTYVCVCVIYTCYMFLIHVI